MKKKDKDTERKKVKNIKKIDMKGPFLITCVVAVICLVLGGIYAFFGGGSYSKTIMVSSIENLESRGKSASNDNLLLADDITVTDSSFSVGEGNAFVGNFDGCGHTVYIEYANADATTSFFSSLGKGAVVKNTRFVFVNVKIEGNFFSGVTKINYGTIQDCSIEYVLEINSKEGMYSPLVAVNCGVVKNIVTSGYLLYNPAIENTEDSDEIEDAVVEDGNGYSDFITGAISGSVHSAVKNEDEKKIAFGSACVYNYGQLKNVIATPNFVGFFCTSRENYLAGRSENVSIAAVCAYVGEQGESDATPVESGLVSISEKTLYTADDTRITKYESFASLIFDADGAVNKTLIENIYDFNNTIWEIDENELCLKLIVN